MQLELALVSLKLPMPGVWDHQDSSSSLLPEIILGMPAPHFPQLYFSMPFPKYVVSWVS